jgi:hypothetical protein
LADPPTGRERHHVTRDVHLVVAGGGRANIAPDYGLSERLVA